MTWSRILAILLLALAIAGEMYAMSHMKDARYWDTQVEDESGDMGLVAKAAAARRRHDAMYGDVVAVVSGAAAAALLIVPAIKKRREHASTRDAMHA